MKVKIKPSIASGEISPPTSKSIAHRLLISAALADGISRILGITPCEDVLATIDCLTALGAEITISDDVCKVKGCDMKKSAPSRALFARESGSTLRFIIPIAALSGANVIIGGKERLMERPLGIYEEIFKERKMLLEKHNNLIFLNGPLPSGEYTVRGDVSSQFISGLLFALPLTDGVSTIKILPPFESKSYVDLTISALKKFGVKIEFTDDLTIKITGNQTYTATDVTVEADFSGAAFLDALNLLGSDVNVLGLDENSLQGDKAYKEFYPLLKTDNPKIDISNCPDLGPVLFMLASELGGAEFIGTERLRIKESDRVSAMAEELKKFGANIEIYENSVIVKKAILHTPKEEISAHNDHRIVMALSVLATKYGAVINDAEVVSKSYPEFFNDIKNAGIEVEFYE